MVSGRKTRSDATTAIPTSGPSRTARIVICIGAINFFCFVAGSASAYISAMYMFAIG